MTPEETAVVEEALENVWEGQCWTQNEEGADPGWPKALVVVQKRSFLFGSILTIATAPVQKLGHPFPIRADVLCDSYTMVYDHATHLGEMEADLHDFVTTLDAIAHDTTNDVGKLRGQALLALTHQRVK